LSAFRSPFLFFGPLPGRHRTAPFGQLTSWFPPLHFFFSPLLDHSPNEKVSVLYYPRQDFFSPLLSYGKDTSDKKLSRGLPAAMREWGRPIGKPLFFISLKMKSRLPHLACFFQPLSASSYGCFFPVFSFFRSFPGRGLGLLATA